MNLPPRAFFSLNEIAARWGCALADIAGWSHAGHLSIVTGIASVICGKLFVAGMVAVKRAMVALARRIAVILHRMWKDDTDFRFDTPVLHAG